MTRVLYLHGFASGPSSSKARHFRERLEAAGARVDVPDLAAGDFERLTITGQLAVVERARREERPGDAVSLIGSSMGGYLAALYAARHPDVARVVLMAPAFAFAFRWAQWIGPAQLERWRSTGAMEVFHYGENRIRRVGYQLLEDAARYEDFPDFPQPALIFHGARDELVPPRFSEEFAASHPNVRLEILESGHELTDVVEYMAAEAVSFLG